MKIVKNIAVIAFAASFMFGSVGFHYANNYTDMSDNTSVATSWGVTYELNSSTSVGWDSALGMMMYFGVPNTGATLRMGWTGAVAETGPAADDGLVAETSMGLGYTWWTGGDAIKTSISTAYDYVMAPGADADATALDALATQDDNSMNLSVTVGFGF